jgi:NAD(P)-dependent dehydrogenase (short-subunit alcohol dehydrogenase family)
MSELLIFGGTGTLGGAIKDRFIKEGWNLTCGTRTVKDSCDFQVPLDSKNLPDLLKGKKFDAVVFAQGANINDSVQNHEQAELLRLFEANVSFISDHVKVLMEHDLIKEKGRVVILSSVWELLTRQDKFAYTVTKAAVGGLVRSLAVDLGAAKGILVNGILPGIVDTPMARGLLKPEQMRAVEDGTPTGRMLVPSDIGNAVYLLANELNTAISGQSLLVDNGWSIARKI